MLDKISWFAEGDDQSVQCLHPAEHASLHAIHAVCAGAVEASGFRGVRLMGALGNAFQLHHIALLHADPGLAQVQVYGGIIEPRGFRGNGSLGALGNTIQ